jgi:hypothetical protein
MYADFAAMFMILPLATLIRESRPVPLLKTCQTIGPARFAVLPKKNSAKPDVAAAN